MTREEEIDKVATEYIKNCTELSNHYSIDENNLENFFIEGALWSDKNPKCPWISSEKDLPCNHKELITDDSRFGRFTKRVFAYHEDNQLYDDDYMYEFNGEWKWGSCRNTKYWFPIPELPKE